MKTLMYSSREDVYNAPTIPWNSDTYTPVSNKLIMDLIEDRLRQSNLVIKNDEYKTARTVEGVVKGVIGHYDITAGDGEFGQRMVFRNSYDKSMSFAFAVGCVVFCCTNGCINGDYQYKRIHRGVINENSSTTIDDIQDSIIGGIGALQNAFEHNVAQLNELKHLEIGPKDVYDILGQLFFEKEVISISQMSIIKKELSDSVNFRHLGDKDFTAFDMYNHVTESLKVSHPLSYIKDHIATHKLFEQLFNV